MTHTDEAIQATMRRYAEMVAAGFPLDWPCAQHFANLHRFAQNPKDDRTMERAALSVQALWHRLKMGAPSLKTITRILAAISSETLAAAKEQA